MNNAGHMRERGDVRTSFQHIVDMQDASAQASHLMLEPVQHTQSADTQPLPLQTVLHEVKALIRFLETTATGQIKISTSSCTIEIHRAPAHAHGLVPGGIESPQTVQTPIVAGGTDTNAIRAPIVGVFYHAAVPGAKPFVVVGDTVEEGQAIGIIEAMKMMNEVVCDRSGIVTEILVRDGQAVQFDQSLVLIRPTATE